MAVIKNNRIFKCLLMMVVSLLLVLGVSIGVSASANYDGQEVDACITISQRLSVKGGSGYYQDANGRWHKSGGQFASNAELGIETPVKTVTGTHGNSLSDPRTNYGYALVDKDTNEILKFGETLYPDLRYSQNS